MRELVDTQIRVTEIQPGVCYVMCLLGVSVLSSAFSPGMVETG